MNVRGAVAMNVGRYVQDVKTSVSHHWRAPKDEGI